MGFKFKSLPETFYRSLTDFSFYRELVRRPLGEGFIYLAALLLLPVLLFTVPQIYEMNRLLARISDSLKGNLPPLRVERGKVIMDEEEGDFFHFETENEFPVSSWRGVLAMLSSRPDRATHQALRRREEGEELSEDEEELIAAFAEREAAGEAGTEWIDEHFPDREAEITSALVDAKLEENPPEDPAVGELLSDSSRFFNFFFRVDLTTDDPELPPGMMGFALGTHSYTISTPLMPKKVSFSETASEVINHRKLEAWRKSFIWQLIPVVIGMMLAVSYLIILLVILGGSAVAGLTASFLKCTLPFRRVFAIALYAVTPAMVFVLIYLGLILLRFNVSYPMLLFLAVYGFYLVSAARSCCSRV